MKKLLVLVLVALAAWQAWKHYPALLHRPPDHQAVVENQSGRTLERVRLIVGRQTFVRESLDSGASVMFPFRVSRDASFKLVWRWPNSGDDHSWSGGWVTAGPVVQRHTITVDAEGGVIYHAENRELPAP